MCAETRRRSLQQLFANWEGYIQELQKQENCGRDLHTEWKSHRDFRFYREKKVSVLVTIVINTTTKSNIKEESILAYGSRRLEVHNSEKRTAAGTGS